MKNPSRSDGIAEDLIRSFVQFGAAELHLKTLVEKSEAKIRNSLIDDISTEVEKLTTYQEQLISIAELRRSVMRKLFSMFDGEKDVWCMVKHLGIGAMTTFEAYQASEDDVELYELWITSHSEFTKALSEFLGTEITDCAACFADMLKGESEYEI